MINFWKNNRRLVAFIGAIFLFGIPFIEIDGKSLLRFDLIEFKLHFFGTIIMLSEFYLLLVASIFLLILITAVTVIFGRVWCGWLCPQTVLLDMAADIASLISKKNRKLIENIVLLFLSAIVSLGMIWYFVSPFDTWSLLLEGNTMITGFFLALWISFYAELAFLGRKFCTSVCPYAMAQNAFFDPETLVVEYDKTRDSECSNCDTCVKVCPVGVNIKEGLQKDCVACALCIDACTTMVAKKNIPTLIDYQGKVKRSKSYVFGVITFASAFLFFFLLFTRTDFNLLIERESLQNVKGLNSYTISLQNNLDKETEFKLEVTKDFQLIGNPVIKLKPFSTYKGVIRVRRNNNNKERVHFILKSKEKIIEQELGYL